MVQFGIHPRVMFELFPFSGDVEHGIRNRIILEDVLEKSRSSRGTVKISLLKPMNGTVVPGSLGTCLMSYWEVLTIPIKAAVKPDAP